MKKRLFCLFLIVSIFLTMPVTVSAIEIIGSIDADDNATLISPMLRPSTTPENAIGVAYNLITQNTYYYDLWGDLIELNPGVSNFSTMGYIPQDVGIANMGTIASPDIVSGPDERFIADSTLQYPHCATAFLIAEYSIDDGAIRAYAYGTATMIGPSVALTSAHSLYSHSWGWPDTVTIYPGIYGSVLTPQLPFGTDSIGEVTEIVVSVPYYETAADKHDWALIRVSEPIGYQCGYLGFENSSFNLEGNLYDPWYVLTGYPSDRNSNGIPYDDNGNYEYITYNQYVGSGVIYYDSNYDENYSPDQENIFPHRYLVHTIDTYKGQSGAAILRLEETATGGFVIVGVHTGPDDIEGCNKAVGISYQLFEIMYAYRNS